jgi:Ser/Thr protein kinase RdoA (MazF antagonist)
LEHIDVEAIFSHYELGVLEHAEALTAGSVQTNLLLHTTRGKFVLRYYRQNRSFNSVVFEANLIAYLKRKGYPCPAILSSKQGKLVGVYKDKPYALFEFLEGTHIKDPNELQQQQLIRHAAVLQNLTKNYRPAYVQYRWNYGVELCERLAADAAQAIATANAQKKLAWYREALSSLALPACLPKGICHADFHFSNVLFKGDTFQALLDFDDANYTFLTLDLACLIQPVLFTFRWDTWSHADPAGEVFEFAEPRKIASIYQQYRKLNVTEKKYLFDVVKMVILIDCLWFFARGEAHDFYEKKEIDALDRLGRERFCRALFGEPT